MYHTIPLAYGLYRKRLKAVFNGAAEKPLTAPGQKILEEAMYCNQCEQTSKGVACTSIGACGKKSDAAALQDMIVYALRGLSLVALHARGKGMVDADTDRLAVKALFTTLTNVSFDTKPLYDCLGKVVSARDALAAKSGYAAKNAGPDSWKPAFTLSGSVPEIAPAAITSLDSNADVASLQQTLLYGLKGVAAYADHAAILGQEDPELYADLYKGLAAGFDGQSRDLNAWVGAVLGAGKSALRSMELLDAANTGAYGHPVPTQVPLGPKAGKAILVSGHDLKDLYTLLVATEGKGVNIYTHGEMLPAHGYPGLKKFPHFIGHYGTAWQNQQKEFAAFPGAILFTTNCIQNPLPTYSVNVFTTGLVSWPGVKHVDNSDFGPVIAHALSLPGFSADDEKNGSTVKVFTGFARNAVLGVAPQVIDAVKSGAIRHFFLVGGCDGAKPGRNYYTEFVEKTPKDTVVLTLACGKFRFFDKDLGTIGGIPRLLDVGQCNDAYSAVQIAVALAKAFNCGVNDLPLSLIVSWYEQKAVAVLLALLHLGIKNIRLGPTLPAFVTPNVLKVLVDAFAIKPIGTAEGDLKEILG